MLTVIVVLSMSLASFANNANSTPFNSNDVTIESIDNADPHTKQYEDMKKVLDEYEQDLKKATTCDDLDRAELAMLFKLMALTENSYTEDATPEETKEIQEIMERLEIDAQKLKQQWGCEPEGNVESDEE
ncbi:MAG: hypothetical protein J6P83_06515 [Bacteroidales bacterium]|nr:hypothetical protein [Bacteroidales bacterium]